MINLYVLSTHVNIFVKTFLYFIKFHIILNISVNLEKNLAFHNINFNLLTARIFLSELTSGVCDVKHVLGPPPVSAVGI